MRRSSHSAGQAKPNKVFVPKTKKGGGMKVCLRRRPRGRGGHYGGRRGDGAESSWGRRCLPRALRV